MKHGRSGSVFINNMHNSREDGRVNVVLLTEDRKVYSKLVKICKGTWYSSRIRKQGKSNSKTEIKVLISWTFVPLCVIGYLFNISYLNGKIVPLLLLFLGVYVETIKLFMQYEQFSMILNYSILVSRTRIQLSLGTKINVLWRISSSIRS